MFISLQRFNAMVTYGPPYGHVHDWYKLVQCDPKSCRKTASSGVLTEPSRLALQGLSWEMGASNHYTDRHPILVEFVDDYINALIKMICVFHS